MSLRLYERRFDPEEPPVKVILVLYHREQEIQICSVDVDPVAEARKSL
jgi:hypothetical protein